MNRQEAIGDIIYQVLKDDNVTAGVRDRAYIADVVSKALDKAGCVLPVPDAERREEIARICNHYNYFDGSSISWVKLTQHQRDICFDDADSILRLIQPTVLSQNLISQVIQMWDKAIQTYEARVDVFYEIVEVLRANTQPTLPELPEIKTEPPYKMPKYQQIDDLESIQEHIYYCKEHREYFTSNCSECMLASNDPDTIFKAKQAYRDLCLETLKKAGYEEKR